MGKEITYKLMTKITQHDQEIEKLSKEIQEMKESIKPLQERKTYLLRQRSMNKSREKSKEMK